MRECQRLGAGAGDREGVRLEMDAENFAHVTLSRPDKFNTFTDAVCVEALGLSCVGALPVL